MMIFFKNFSPGKTTTGNGSSMSRGSSLARFCSKLFLPGNRGQGTGDRESITPAVDGSARSMNGFLSGAVSKARAKLSGVWRLLSGAIIRTRELENSRSGSFEIAQAMASNVKSNRSMISVATMLPIVAILSTLSAYRMRDEHYKAALATAMIKHCCFVAFSLLWVIEQGSAFSLIALAIGVMYFAKFLFLADGSRSILPRKNLSQVRQAEPSTDRTTIFLFSRKDYNTAEMDFEEEE